MSNDALAGFQARYDQHAADPAEVVRLFVEALLAIETAPDLAPQMMCTVIARNLLTATPGTATGYALPRADQTIARLSASPAIARALAGGTPDAAYADADLSRFALDRSYSARAQGVDYPAPGKAKLFVACGGADTPRPITLARNNAGQWKVTEWSSLTVGVKRPAAAAGDF